MAEKQTKFIFVTGGVVSGLGKGITVPSPLVPDGSRYSLPEK